MDTLMRTDRPRFTSVLVSGALTIVLIALLFVFRRQLNFAANDDMVLVALLKGLFGLTAGVDAIFISPVLGVMLHLLYQLMPSLPWYSLMLYAGLSVAFFSTSLAILSCNRNFGPTMSGLGFVGFFFALTSLTMSFASVSLLLWISGCALLLMELMYSDRKSEFRWLPSMQLSAAYLLRPDLLLLQIALALPLLLTMSFRASRKMACYGLAPLIVVLTLNLVCTGLIRRGGEYSEYLRYNSLRGEFNDTKRGLPSERTSLALQAADWSREDYAVAFNWWHHDHATFNADKVEKFLETNSHELDLISFQKLQLNWARHWSMILPIALWCVVLFILHAVRNSFWVGCMAILFAIVALIMSIRFPDRIAFPLYVMLVVNGVLLSWSQTKKSGKYHKIYNLMLAFLFFLFIYWNYDWLTKPIKQSDYLIAQKNYIQKCMVDISILNGGDTIIADVNPHKVPLYFSPFQENNAAFYIHTLPAGWLSGSPAYNDFLKKNGLGDPDTLVRNMIDNRRLVLRFWDSSIMRFDSYMKSVFLPYLRQHYNPAMSEHNVALKILRDFRRSGIGFIYFHLVTVPSVEAR